MKKYYGKETEAALRNFPFSSPPLARGLVYAIAEIKIAAAKAWAAVGGLSPDIAAAIAEVGEEIIRGKFDGQFFLPALQGGAGTSIHMNVNEVMATRATEILKNKKKNITVHPNDHVNRGQSTNDVIPSALKIASIRIARDVIRALEECVLVLRKKAKEFHAVPKLGRTHLQDAVPMTLGEEFFSYAAALERDGERIRDVVPYLYELNLGGTAIGNSINAPLKFRKNFYSCLKKETGLPLKSADDLLSQTWSAGDFSALSSVFVLLTVDLSKIATDLKILSSGPRGGIGEIILRPLQAGSSIMPGKVNPVLLEVLNQLYCIVLGNDIAIRAASHASQLELSTMGPVIADKLLSSGNLIVEVVTKVSVSCFKTLRADKKKCLEHLEKSTAYATLLVPRLGYDMVSSLVKEAIRTGKTLREVVVGKNILTEHQFNALTHV